MTGYDDYQTEEEYIAAWKKSAGGEMDTKELVKRLRKIADASRRADGTDIPLGQDLRAANDVIQRLERERDEALAKLGATARLALSLEVEADERIAVAESELTTLRSRVAKMEGVLRQVVHACFHYTGEDQDDLVNDAYDNAASLLSQEEQQP